LNKSKTLADILSINFIFNLSILFLTRDSPEIQERFT